MAHEIPENLKVLKSAAVAASEAFYGHKFEGDKADADAVIAFDLEEKRLLQASTRARLAYEAALNAHLAAEAV